MFTVADVMTNENLVVLNEKDDLGLAEAMFQFGGIHHLPVVKEGELRGLITHRDFLGVLARYGTTAGRFMQAADVMRRDVIRVDPRTPLTHALDLMMRKKCGCLPVVDGNELVGLVTETDVLRFAKRITSDLDEVERTANALRPVAS